MKRNLELIAGDVRGISDNGILTQRARGFYTALTKDLFQEYGSAPPTKRVLKKREKGKEKPVHKRPMFASVYYEDTGETSKGIIQADPSLAGNGLIGAYSLMANVIEPLLKKYNLNELTGYSGKIHLYFRNSWFKHKVKIDMGDEVYELSMPFWYTFLAPKIWGLHNRIQFSRKPRDYESFSRKALKGSAKFAGKAGLGAAKLTGKAGLSLGKLVGKGISRGAKSLYDYHLDNKKPSTEIQQKIQDRLNRLKYDDLTNNPVDIPISDEPRGVTDVDIPIQVPDDYCWPGNIEIN